MISASDMMSGRGKLVNRQKLTEKDLDDIRKENELQDVLDNNINKNIKNPPRKKRKFSHPHGNQVLSYPLGMTPDESNGGRLLIKCFEYVPSKIESNKETFFEMRENKKGEVLQSEIKADTVDIEVQDTSSRIGKFDRSGNELEKGQREKSLYFIELPIPQDVNDSNTVTYADDTKNILELAGLFAASAFESRETATKGLKIFESLFDKGAKSNAFLFNAENRSRILAAAGAKAITPFGSQITVNQALARSTGSILNSNLELLFDNVNLRSFPFSINFSPRNPKESLRVKHIIRALKSSMAAKKSLVDNKGGVFLHTPDVFKLRYLHNGGDHPFLNSFKPCALTGMAVNYTNSGTYATYQDGTPVSIQVNLTFKELNPIYNEDYDQFDENDNKGVGF